MRLASLRPLRLLACAAGLTSPLAAQTVPAASSVDTSLVARGVVRRTDGTPIARATIYLLETLESAVTDSAGRFTLRAAHRGWATIVARGVGFRPTTLEAELPTDSLLAFVLERQPAQLASVAVVAAGEYTIGAMAGAALTPLEVVQMPGAAGNVARAIQSLPGVQAVDEGTGLFVRGGDVTETRVLIDDAWMLSPIRLENPTGHTTSTVNPFLLQRTVFAAGGFGVTHGNALSGLVRMETAGAPVTREHALTASIGGATAAGAWRVHPRVGVRAAMGLNSLRPLIAAFGEAQPFDPPPRGGDASLTVEWRTSAAGRVRWFGVQQSSAFGVGDATPIDAPTDDASGRYRTTTREAMHVLSWRDSSTAWRPALTVAWSGFSRREEIGDRSLFTRLWAPQLLAAHASMSPRAVRVARCSANGNSGCVRIGSSRSGCAATPAR